MNPHTATNEENSMGFRAAQHAYEMQDGSNEADERGLRLFEGQLGQLETDLDYFGEQLFETELTDAEKYLIGRALDAFVSESLAVETLRRRLASVNAEHMAKHAGRFS